MPQRKVCYERIKPRFHFLRNVGTISETEALAVKNVLWPNGTTLRVKFINGTTEQHNLVKQFAVKWSDYAHISFRFVEDADAEIRITFNPNDGAWSYMGTECLDIPFEAPTMNLGWVDEGVILHEFGHALGLGHEHQNPIGGVQWDKEAVYQELAGPPNFWDRNTVDHNIFNKYEKDKIIGTDVDPLSIMMYPIPENWTINDFMADPNDSLSEQDKTFIAKMYPKPTSETHPTIPISELIKVKGEISQGGSVNTYNFEASKDGQYTIVTEGSTDVFLSLYKGKGTEQLISHDDDSGSDGNAKIIGNLTAGDYTVEVRHFQAEEGTGSYKIMVIFEGAIQS